MSFVVVSAAARAGAIAGKRVDAAASAVAHSVYDGARAGMMVAVLAYGVASAAADVVAAVAGHS